MKMMVAVKTLVEQQMSGTKGQQQTNTSLDLLSLGMEDRPTQWRTTKLFTSNTRSNN